MAATDKPRRQVTQHDIAARCGLSQKAVSLALQGDARLTAETIARVRAAAAEMGYHPANHQAARRLVARRYGRRVTNHVIALFMPRAFQRMVYFATIVQGVLDALATSQFALVIVQYNGADCEFPPIFDGGEVDGVICYGSSPSTLLHRLRETPGGDSMPVVSLTAPLPGCSAVTTDSCRGAYLATRHLLELGHRNILHFYNPDWGPEYVQRFAGLTQALHEYGLNPADHACLCHSYLGNIIPPHHLAIPSPTTDYLEAGFRAEYLQAFLAYLREHPEITAILAQNDIQGRRIGYLLRKTGCRIPQEMSIIGFDDTDPLLDEFGDNILTTVHLPLEEIGRTAAELLLRQIAAATPTPEQITLPTALVVRGSTANPGATGDQFTTSA